MDKVPFTVILSYEEHEILMKHCIKKDVSRTGMIRALLREALKKKWFEKVTDFANHQKLRTTKKPKPKRKKKK